MKQLLYGMSDEARLSDRDRENYLIKLKKEFAYAGASIPELITTVDGEQIRLRSITMEIFRSKGSLSEEELDEVDRVAALVRRERNAIVKRIRSADMTKEEADNLFMFAIGLGRALDTLDRAREPKTTVTEAARKAKMEDSRRWLSLVKGIYGKEKKRDGFQ
jgi:hypothetical protein